MNGNEKDNPAEPSVNDDSESRPETPSKSSVAPSGASADPATASASPLRSNAIVISGGGKRRRLLSGSGPSSGLLGAVPPSPPKFATLDEIMRAASGVTNMALAHEIAVDKDFKLEKADPPSSSFQGALKSMVHRAFWDILEERLNSDPPEYERAVKIFEDIREMLKGLLLPQHERLKRQIEQVLDMDVIAQQAEAGTIDPYGYTDFVLNLMAKLCAPVRDDDIASLRSRQESRSDLVALLRSIVETLELMKIDMANFTIQQLRPFIQSQSVEYEKQKFSEFLQTQSDGLLYTRNWLSAALESSSKLNEQAGDSLDSSTQSPLTPAAVLVDAFVSLFFRDESLPYPETLLMDEGRLLHLRDQFHRIVLVGSVLLLVYNAVGGPIAGLAALKSQLKSSVQVLLGALPSEAQGDSSEGASSNADSELAEKLSQIFERVKADVESSLTSHGFRSPSDETWSALRLQITGLRSPDQPVVVIVSKRLGDFVKAVIEAKDSLQIPAGLSGLQKEILDMVSAFMRIVTHNRAVYGDYYQDIIQTLTRPISQ